MKSYKFYLTRTYETIIEIDADDYEKALAELSKTDIYAIEMEQRCVVKETLVDEIGYTI